eukprot:TRINITY_DN665_c0_g1_i1.p1 TRINITY_DN665_c0_g1~~TRINITY_DN665_c0_g1_i1.p1  ORF type:complete len:274 (+),score=74.47 TRINITY_DN665_c0_g1_i1:72-893(+)
MKSIVLVLALLPLICTALPQQQVTAMTLFAKSIGFPSLFSSGDPCISNYVGCIGRGDAAYINSISMKLFTGATGVFPSNLLTHLPNLTIVDFRNNKGLTGDIKVGVHIPPSVTQVYLDGSGITSFSVSGKNSLTQFNAQSTSAVPGLKSLVLQDTSSLQYLNLKGNKISTLSLNSAAPGGVFVIAAANQINFFEYNDKIKFSKLDLSNNSLTSFRWSSTANMPYVDLNTNKLKRITVGLGVDFKTNPYCDFHANPLTCPVQSDLAKNCFATCG